MKKFWSVVFMLCKEVVKAIKIIFICILEGLFGCINMLIKIDSALEPYRNKNRKKQLTQEQIWSRELQEQQYRDSRLYGWKHPKYNPTGKRRDVEDVSRYFK